MVVAIGNVLKKISSIIKKSKPDIILTGFDIGANFGLTVAGAHLNIPVAHIQGGNGRVLEDLCDVARIQSVVGHIERLQTRARAERLAQSLCFV